MYALEQGENHPSDSNYFTTKAKERKKRKKGPGDVCACACACACAVPAPGVVLCCAVSRGSGSFTAMQ